MNIYCYESLQLASASHGEALFKFSASYEEAGIPRVLRQPFRELSKEYLFYHDDLSSSSSSPLTQA